MSRCGCAALRCAAAALAQGRTRSAALDFLHLDAGVVKSGLATQVGKYLGN